MSRRGAIVAGVGLLVVVVCGLALIAQRVSGVTQTEADKIGVPIQSPIGELGPRQEVCQGPVDLAKRITNLGLGIDTGDVPGPPLSVTIRRLSDRAVLTRVQIPRGYILRPPDYFGTALPKAVAAGQTVEVCARNEGRRRLPLFGKETIATAGAFVGDRPLAGDWAIFFPKPEADRRSMLHEIPDVLQRASVLRPGIVTPAFYIVLVALLLVGGPLVLWRAVVGAVGAPADEPASPARDQD